MQTNSHSTRFSRTAVVFVTVLVAVMIIFALTAAIVPGFPMGGGGGVFTGFVP